MNARITQSYWNYQKVAPAKPADKPRREKQSFVQILKAQTTKGERRALAFLGGYVMLIVVVQVLIHIGVITSPGYL